MHAWRMIQTRPLACLSPDATINHPQRTPYAPWPTVPCTCSTLAWGPPACHALALPSCPDCAFRREKDHRQAGSQLPCHCCCCMALRPLILLVPLHAESSHAQCRSRPAHSWTMHVLVPLAAAAVAVVPARLRCLKTRAHNLCPPSQKMTAEGQGVRVRWQVLRASPQCGRCPHPIVVNRLNAQPDAADMYMHCRANVCYL